MSSQRVGDMTVEELKELVRDLLRKEQAKTDPRSAAEVLASVDKHRWHPPAGAISSLELLRQDRDR